MDKQSKRIATYAVSGLIILIVALFAIFQPQGYQVNSSLKDQAAKIWGDEIDFSNSLYPPSDYEVVRAEIEETAAEVFARDVITGEQVVQLAREAKRVRDFEKAVALFELATTTDFSDLYYLVDYGNSYLQMEQYEKARQVFEPMKVTYPVFEAYIGLAEAYKNLEGTPNYVVDAIYEESLQRHSNRYDVVQKYVEWLEKTDREEKTIQYYQILNEIAPQPVLEQKLEELKNKFPDSYKEL